MNFKNISLLFMARLSTPFTVLTYFGNYNVLCQQQIRAMSLMADGAEKKALDNKRETWKICETHRRKRLIA